MLTPKSLILNFQTFRWAPLDSTPFDEYDDRPLLPRMSTRPSDYRPPPNSPHVGIICQDHDLQHQVRFLNMIRSLYLSQDYQIHQLH